MRTLGPSEPGRSARRRIRLSHSAHHRHRVELRPRSRCAPIDARTTTAATDPSRLRAHGIAPPAFAITSTFVHHHATTSPDRRQPLRRVVPCHRRLVGHGAAVARRRAGLVRARGAFTVALPSFPN